MKDVVFYTPRTWGVMDRMNGVPKDDTGFYVAAEDYRDANRRIGSLKSVLELVLMSDMAQREEDEGHISPILTAVRNALKFVE